MEGTPQAPEDSSGPPPGRRTGSGVPPGGRSDPVRTVPRCALQGAAWEELLLCVVSWASAFRSVIRVSLGEFYFSELTDTDCERLSPGDLCAIAQLFTQLARLGTWYWVWILTQFDHPSVLQGLAEPELSGVLSKYNLHPVMFKVVLKICASSSFFFFS